MPNGDFHIPMRSLNPDEMWRAFTRQHRALTAEVKELRNWVGIVSDQIKDLKKLMPKLEIYIPETPKETADFTGNTYRDEDGKFPHGEVGGGKDWLKDSDFE